MTNGCAIEIRELTAFRSEYVAALDGLMRELAPGASVTPDRVKRVIETPDTHQYAAFEGDRMVGCATLCVCYTPEMVIGFVEAVVVTAECRGRHLGRRLMERILADAESFGVQTIHLTSNPKRVAANALYQSLGFELYDTNCYKLKL